VGVWFLGGTGSCGGVAGAPLAAAPPTTSTATSEATIGEADGRSVAEVGLDRVERCLEGTVGGICLVGEHDSNVAAPHGHRRVDGPEIWRIEANCGLPPTVFGLCWRCNEAEDPRIDLSRHHRSLRPYGGHTVDSQRRSPPGHRGSDRGPTGGSSTANSPATSPS